MCRNRARFNLIWAGRERKDTEAGGNEDILSQNSLETRRKGQTVNEARLVNNASVGKVQNVNSETEYIAIESNRIIDAKYANGYE